MPYIRMATSQTFFRQAANPPGQPAGGFGKILFMLKFRIAGKFCVQIGQAALFALEVHRQPVVNLQQDCD